eukprot:6211316-Pleurochrysis_carterae.AAC.1
MCVRVFACEEHAELLGEALAQRAQLGEADDAEVAIAHRVHVGGAVLLGRGGARQGQRRGLRADGSVRVNDGGNTRVR